MCFDPSPVIMSAPDSRRVELFSAILLCDAPHQLSMRSCTAPGASCEFEPLSGIEQVCVEYPHPPPPLPSPSRVERSVPAYNSWPQASRLCEGGTSSSGRPCLHVHVCMSTFTLSHIAGGRRHRTVRCRKSGARRSCACSAGSPGHKGQLAKPQRCARDGLGRTC